MVRSIPASLGKDASGGTGATPVTTSQTSQTPQELRWVGLWGEERFSRGGSGEVVGGGACTARGGVGRHPGHAVRTSTPQASWG